jgi:hypothetical protein
MNAQYRSIKAGILVAALLFSLSRMGRAQFTFTTNNGAITITHYSGSSDTAIIPGTTNGYPVSIVGTNAFASQISVTNVTIPDSVTNIEYQAFAACTGLTTVRMGTNIAYIGDWAFYTCFVLTNFTMPASVSSIGNFAFDECRSLPSVNIPSGATNIGGSAFAFCSSMNAITVDPLNPVYSSVDGVLFDERQTTLIQCPGGKAGSYAIPDGVTNISGAPFAGCSSLVGVIVPNSISSIGIAMFEYCFNLTNVMIPDSVTSIGSYAFYECRSLTDVTIPNSVTSIGDEAFSECFSLSALYFLGNSPTVGNIIFDGDNAGIVYYLPRTQGWENNGQFWPWLTELWIPQLQTNGGDFGVQSNGFGFNINWASGQTVVVEACTNLANTSWLPVQTNMLSGGSFYFSDPQWTNYPARFYRLRSP